MKVFGFQNTGGVTPTEIIVETYDDVKVMIEAIQFFLENKKPAPLVDT